MCCVIKPLDKKHVTFRYDKYKCRPGQEKPLLIDVLNELSKYDLLVGHNAQNFDLKYLKSRAIQLGVPYTLEPFVYDTMMAFRRTGYRTVQNAIGKPSASLAMVIDFFDIRVTKKYPLMPRQHWKAVWQEGEERTRAMNHLVAHCQADVTANELVYWKLLKVDRVWGLRRVK